MPLLVLLQTVRSHVKETAMNSSILLIARNVELKQDVPTHIPMRCRQTNVEKVKEKVTEKERKAKEKERKVTVKGRKEKEREKATEKVSNLENRAEAVQKVIRKTRTVNHPLVGRLQANQLLVFAGL